MRLIDAEMLCKYCDNNINHSITPNEIMRMPYIEAEPVKHAHWIKTASPYHFKCSSCGVIANIKFHSVEDHKFCWHCGARMDGESE